jgi:hypothetical protein
MTPMTEDDLRALIRDTVVKALAAREAGSRAPEPSKSAIAHPSHGVYVTLVNAGDACVIEPAVAYTHCEYCRSHGH